MIFPRVLEPTTFISFFLYITLFFLNNQTSSSSHLTFPNTVSQHLNSTEWYEVKSSHVRTVCSNQKIHISVDLSEETQARNSKHPVLYLKEAENQEECIFVEKLIHEVGSQHFELTVDLNKNWKVCSFTKVFNPDSNTLNFQQYLVIHSRSYNSQTTSIPIQCEFKKKKNGPKHRSKRQSNNEQPQEILLGEVVGRAPIPSLTIQVLQGSTPVDGRTVRSGTPLQMVIDLDGAESREVYGISVDSMRVSEEVDGGQQQEPLIIDGCSVDPYLFENFENTEGEDALKANFKAFKFPDSNVVIFRGSVDVCLDVCREGFCGGGGQFGRQGRRRKSRSSKGNIHVNLITVLHVSDD